MERRRFLGGAGTGLLAALARGGVDPFALARQQDDGGGDFAALLEALRGALAETDAAVVDGASCLGYGVVLLTTGAQGPDSETFDAELEAVATAYLDHVEAVESPLAFGLVVEVYPSADAARAREDVFASYVVPTAGAREAVDAGERGAYVSAVRSTVSPPVWAAAEGGEPAVELASHELVTVTTSEPTGTTETPAVDATIENRGNGRSGDATLLVDWYDADGTFLATDEAALRTLRPGETWLARVYPSATTDAGAIADYEATVVFGDPDTGTPEGLTVAESQLSVNGEARIHGALENGTGEALFYVEVIGRVLDSEGRVLGDDWTNDTQFAAGATWRFDLRYDDPDRDRIEAIDGFEVVPLGSF